MSIDQGDQNLVVGETAQLTATVTVDGNADEAVVWGGGDSGVASVSGEGLIEAVAAGTASVTATSVADASKSDDVVVTVAALGALRWTDQFGSEFSDSVDGVATDGSGNVFVVGSTYGAFEGTNNGGLDGYVRKYGADGSMVWTRQFGTGGDDEVFGVATDGDGHVFVAGSTSGDLVADGANAGNDDGFVRKYGADGSVVWTRQFGTGGVDEVFGVATDGDGNVFAGGITMGLLSGDGTYFGARDGFVRKYVGNGDEGWTRQFGTSTDDYVKVVATDGVGNVFAAGHTLGGLKGRNRGKFDGFVRKYAGNGDKGWTRQFGTENRDNVHGIATDGAGNVFVAGHAEELLEVGGVYAGDLDGFVRKYAGNGDEGWTRQFGTSKEDDVWGVATDGDGDVFVAGETEGDLQGTNSGVSDGFVRSFGR